MQDATAESIKSLEGFRIAWVEEAQTLSQRSLSLLRPTIRTQGSQLWANWNPHRKSDAIDDFLRAKKPDNAVVVQANWRDNPWFPDVLDEERRLDFEIYPERYAHIWEGDYAKAFEGAYFAKHLEQARKDGRIGHVPIDPVLPVKGFFDIGGAGHSSDAMAIWICQFVNREIRLLDYIEGVGQPLGYYATELRRRGWKEAVIHLPHDGVATNNISGKRYIDHWIEAGFECASPIKNSGTGAAMMRIEAARRVFPRCCFNEKTTEAGRDALGYYHERKTRTAMSVSGRSMIGRAMPPMHSAILRSLTRSRRQPSRKSGGGALSRHHAEPSGRRSFNFLNLRRSAPQAASARLDTLLKRDHHTATLSSGRHHGHRGLVAEPGPREV